MRRLLLFTAIFSLTQIHAQSYKSSMSFQKANYAVAAIQVPYDEDVVTAAVKDYMSGKGYKDAHYKDFFVYRDVPIGGSQLSDAYFNVEKKSRSEKDVTIVRLLPVKKGETLSPSSAEDSTYIAAAVVYLDSLKYHLQSYSLQQQIDLQQKALDKIKTKMNTLKNDSGDIAKKIRNTESNLAQNKIDQASQTQLISGLATGDQTALAKAHKKMDKLMDSQNDYEKKLRNYKADLEENTKDRETQQGLFDRGTQSLTALKQRHQNL